MAVQSTEKHRKEQKQEYRKELLFHRTVYLLTRLLYRICRFCVFGYFKYNTDTNKLYIYQKRNFAKYLSLLVKIILILLDYLNYTYVIFRFEAHYLHDSTLTSTGYSFYLECLIYTTVNWQLVKMIIFLHSWKNNESCVAVINKVLDMHKTMISSFDYSYFTIEYNILVIPFLEFGFTILQIWNQIMRHRRLLVFKYQIILFELIYWMYLLYQLILIAWHRVLLSSSKTCNGRLPNRTRQMHIYRMYFRICEVHHEVTQIWVSISGALFACIAMLSADISEELYDVIYQEKTTSEKLTFFIMFKMGNCIAPLLKVFILGLCNNRIENLTKRLSQQMYINELIHCSRSYNKLELIQRCQYTNLLDGQFNCFCLEQHIYPIRNHIWHKGQSINTEFLLQFVWIAFLNAMSNLQYALTKKMSWNIYY